MKLHTLASTSIAVLLLLTHAVQAENINKKVPAEVLDAFCATQPVGSETKAQFTAADGSVITGEVECEAEDRASGSDDPATHDLTDDSVTGVDDNPGDDDSLSDDSGSDDDSEDDNGSGGSGSDDHGGDDHGGDDGNDDSGNDD